MLWMNWNILQGFLSTSYMDSHILQKNGYMYITNKFAYNSNAIAHMTCKIANIVDGFGNGTKIFGCKMNEY